MYFFTQSTVWKGMNCLGLKKKLFVSCNPTLTSFYSKKSLPLSFYRPSNSQSTKNMHKTHIFDQKNNGLIITWASTSDLMQGSNMGSHAISGFLFFEPINALKDSLKVFIWIYDTFDNNFGIDFDFTKYMT